jgi:hypothetical protein
MKLRIQLLFTVSMITVVIIICAKESKGQNHAPAINTDSPPADPSGTHLPVCPENHHDSIVPIVYGFPSEASFQKADSGLIELGGCEVSDNSPQWFCKKHQLSF